MVDSLVLPIIMEWVLSLPFWLFVAVVIVEAFISISGMTWWAGFLLSTVVGALLTLVGMRLQSLSLVIQSNALMARGEIVWGIAMVIKVVMHFLPIPGLIRLVASGALSVIVFLLANFVFGAMVW